MNTSKIITRAAEMADQFETFKRNGSDEDIVKLKEGHPEWMTDVIRAGHGDSFPDDWHYDRIRSIVYRISESSESDDLQDVIYEMEPDVYTADLTRWLHNDVNNVYYLTECLEEGEYKDGFALLAAAQARHIEEIAQRVLDALDNLTSGDDSGDDDDDNPEDPENEPDPMAQSTIDDIKERLANNYDNLPDDEPPTPPQAKHQTICNRCGTPITSNVDWVATTSNELVCAACYAAIVQNTTIRAVSILGREFDL